MQRLISTLEWYLPRSCFRSHFHWLIVRALHYGVWSIIQRGKGYILRFQLEGGDYEGESRCNAGTTQRSERFSLSIFHLSTRQCASTFAARKDRGKKINPRQHVSGGSKCSSKHGPDPHLPLIFLLRPFTRRKSQLSRLKLSSQIFFSTSSFFLLATAVVSRLLRVISIVIQVVGFFSVWRHIRGTFHETPSSVNEQIWHRNEHNDSTEGENKIVD